MIIIFTLHFCPNLLRNLTFNRATFMLTGRTSNKTCITALWVSVVALFRVLDEIVDICLSATFRRHSSNVECFC